jgi:hypothetical protein
VLNIKKSFETIREVGLRSELEEGAMSSDYEKAADVFCAALAIKDKKKNLYTDAMKSCPDQVGIETFRMLKEAEEEQIAKIQHVYEAFKQGKASADACRFYALETHQGKDLLRRVAEEHGRAPKACLDDVAAIETGLNLENAAIEYFERQLQGVVSAVEREFLTNLAAEEREHHRLLADLKFYYVDPDNWFLEKEHQRLDGA